MLAEDDVAAFARFTHAVGTRLQVVGDDLLVSDAALRIEERLGTQARFAGKDVFGHTRRSVAG